MLFVYSTVRTSHHAEYCMDMVNCNMYINLNDAATNSQEAVKPTFSDSWLSSGSPASSMNTTKGEEIMQMTEVGGSVSKLQKFNT